MGLDPSEPAPGISSVTPPSFALDRARIEEFIAKGFVIIRGAVAPDKVEQICTEVLFGTDSAPSCRGREDRGAPTSLDGVDFLEPSTWPTPTIQMATGKSFEIETFAPRLWGALASLVGDVSNLGRSTIGEQFILNGDRRPRRMGRHRQRHWAQHYWHIDHPSKHTRLAGRTDGLVLLILWSKVKACGGGTLFSGESLDQVVRQLEGCAEGVDTTIKTWGRDIAGHCEDIIEFNGEPGDVLISHSLALHAGQFNFTGALRVLENPTIMVNRELNYSPENPSPSPVEACVIRRLSDRALPVVDVRVPLREAAEWLAHNHCDYFLPGRLAWQARTSATVREHVFEMDRALWAGWLAAVAGNVRERQESSQARIEKCVAIIAESFALDSAFDMRVEETVETAEFANTSAARLIRGFVCNEAQHFALAHLLAQLFDDVSLLRGQDSGAGQALVRVGTEEGAVWLDVAGTPQILAEDPSCAQPRLQALLATSAPLSHASSQPLLDLMARLTDDAPASTPPKRSEVWGRFLRARTHQVTGERNEARATFEGLRKSLSPQNKTARVASVFEERMRAHEPALVL